MQFTVKELVLLTPSGTAAGFNSKAMIFVVEDMNQVLSVVSADIIKWNSDFEIKN